jgi:hypothetical protein
VSLFPPWFPYREPKKVEGHPLIGKMEDTEPEDAREMLKRRPPSGGDLLELGMEERRCRDRAEMYRVLAEFKR